MAKKGGLVSLVPIFQRQARITINSLSATLEKLLRCHYGAPISRDRYYLLIIRWELMREEAVGNPQEFTKQVASELQHGSKYSWNLSWH